ncbi:TKL protein kinase [Phytophthora palmivora]|uniref:TKL protein kinase n=1 Tax=Phytophthora palmivora TaxID=4796 RepID=A0A2P4XEK6_9STRA|nr:TKL protein kinase [Phytophthora palmivora]
MGDNSEFQEQVQQWFALNHPNILKLYGVCDVNNIDASHYFVCEYAAHGKLSDYLNQQRRESGGKSPRLVWQKLLEAAQGVQYLHERGLVHGNLKAENMLVSGDGIVKLAGFGQSGALEEVVAGDERLASDVFALDG